MGYKHALGIDLSSPIMDRRMLTLDGPTIVTASVESIVVYEPLDINQNLLIEGQVVSVGSSSMDVALKLKSLTTERELLQAEMTMVARETDPLTGVRRFCKFNADNGKEE